MIKMGEIEERVREIFEEKGLYDLGVNKALRFFKTEFPDDHIPNSLIRRVHESGHIVGYKTKPNRRFMGNKFSPMLNSYQMDIYFENKIPYLLLININTRYAWAKMMRSKSLDQVLRAFEEFVKDFNPRLIECDAEKAFISLGFTRFCRENRIHLRIVEDQLHSDLSIINRFCRTLRERSGTVEARVKNYNDMYHDSIGMKPVEMEFDTNKEIAYISDQFYIRDEKEKMLEKSDLRVRDKVRYILDEEVFSKGAKKLKLSKYWYFIEFKHSPFLFDIIAQDGSIKRLPRFRLVKVSPAEEKELEYAPTIEQGSSFFLYQKIIDYQPFLKKDGSLNITKTRYIVEAVFRDETGKKIKKEIPLRIYQLRLGDRNNLSSLEAEFLKKNSSRFEVDDSNFLIPIK